MIDVLLACTLLAQDAGEPLILRGRLLLDPSKPPEEGVVFVTAGRITAVGRGIEDPPGAKGVELPKGAWIVPGFIDAHSHLGSALEADEPTESLTPQVKAVEGFSTRHADVRSALGSGVTRAAIAPGDGNVIGGRIGVVLLNGERYDRALLLDVAALKGSIGEESLRRDREPTSRTGALGMIRDFLRSRPAGLPLFLHASTEGEIRSALALQEETGAKVVLVHAREAAKAVDAIRAAGVAVAFGPLTVHDSREILETPGVLARAGIPVALVSDAPRTSPEQLRIAAILAVKSGLPAGDAMRALTSTPAGLLGLGRAVGSIEKGFDADLVVWTGDPLDSSSAVERVIVRGRTTYRRESP